MENYSNHQYNGTDLKKLDFFNQKKKKKEGQEEIGQCLLE